MSDTPDAADPPVHSTPAPPFPPPNPAEQATAGGRRAGPLLALLAIAGLAVALLMTVLWLGARSDRDDAEDDRDAAIVERDAATNSRIEAETELRATEEALADAEDAAAGTDPDLLSELEQQVADLTAENQELTEANADLEARLADAEAALETAEQAPATTAPAAEPDAASPDTTAPETTAPTTVVTPPADGATFDPATTPEFARYIGEVLSSAAGSSRLGAAQSTCFGTEVIRAIGLDALGAGLHNARTNDANNAVVGAMQTAAGICNIDPGLVFG